MKLFYSYMRRLFAHIPTLSKVVQIPLKIFSPANQWHRLVMPGRCFFLVFCFILFSLNDARPQSPEKSGAVSGKETLQPLLVGQKVPEEFWTKEHLFYIDGDTVKKNLSEFKGKLLILDFWSTSCASCLSHQKDISSYKMEFGDKINIIMVNSTSTKDDFHKIKEFHRRNQETHFKGGFVSIIHDDSLKHRFRHVGFPNYIWINASGYFQIQTFRNLLDRSASPPYLVKGGNR